MLLRYFYDNPLAQASYMVGCPESGEALVIDPHRSVDQYIRVAAADGLRITRVAETHIHADYVSGSRELAHRTGARLYLSAEGGPDWQYAFADDDSVLLKDGDTWMVGSVRITALHTPGHTPEHLSFMVTDTATTEEPLGIFTGDCLFVGDVGRPDLLEEAAGIADSKEPGARQQFQSVMRLRDLPDYLQIWPGHGAGSACGKALGMLPSTTLGYEKRFNRAFQLAGEDAFAAWLLSGQPEPPRYFAQMKTVNRVGPALLHTLVHPVNLDVAAITDVLLTGALVVDTRPGDDFAAAHIKGTLNVPYTSDSFSTYIGWFVDYNRPLYLIAPEDQIERLTGELRAIGVDNLPGYFPLESTIQYSMERTLQVSAEDVAGRYMPRAALLIDVRSASEFAEERITGAEHIPMGYLPRHVAALPRDRRIILHCQTGIRSQIAASLLQKHGFSNVMNMAGGLDAWRGANLPTE